jgi:hypothetical protein
MVNITCPERFRMNEFLQRYLETTRDPRKVVADPKARYFGAKLEGDTLAPAGATRISKTGFDEWTTESRNARH